MKRAWAIPLNPAYGVALAAKNALYQRGLLPVRQLERPVVSVGSLSAGGAGKTPVVAALAQLLQQHGIAVDVLSRGYGRRGKDTVRVLASGRAERFGDEPLELARAGLDVFVSRERWRAGRLAEKMNQTRVHLLDDGFQHRQLARALDLVLLTSQDAKDRLLPGGNLREPLHSLSRAGAVIVRREEFRNLKAIILEHTDAPVWQIERTLQVPAELPARPFVFCAIARPAGLLDMLAQLGIQPSGVLLRRDHHQWTTHDLAEVIARARQAGSDALLTTVKDSVKLTPDALRQLQALAPVVLAGLRVSFLDPEQVLGTLRGVLAQADDARPPLPA